ncbi:MAG: GIY-YIG nuclease family protein [Elusimicrobiota bacterium]|jgi:putative endonuclease|nr:GIY-YIG nuclease family protein [Elusimicrobiota bacterium]
MSKQYYVYIVTNKKRGTLYIGITNDITRRMYEHRSGLYKGFTKKYKLNRLVYIEDFNDVDSAIWREKCLKEWKRMWKIKLIEDVNPKWEDLGDEY